MPPLNEGIVLGRLEGSSDIAYAVATNPAQFNQTLATTDPTTQVQSPLPSSTTQTSSSTQVLEPQFISHQDGDRISSRNGFTLQGQTAPGATINVKVNSAPKGIGGILGSIVGGNVLVNQSVTADDQGNFEVSVPSPLLPQKGTKYLVEAIARSGDRSSQTVEMELIQD